MCTRALIASGGHFSQTKSRTFRAEQEFPTTIRHNSSKKHVSDTLSTLLLRSQLLPQRKNHGWAVQGCPGLSPDFRK